MGRKEAMDYVIECILLGDRHEALRRKDLDSEIQQTPQRVEQPRETDRQVNPKQKEQV